MKFKSFKIVKICLTIKIKYLARNFFFIKILFYNHYFSPLNTTLLWEKVRNREAQKHTVPDVDPEYCFGSYER